MQPNQRDVEMKVRGFIADEMMKEEARDAALTEEMDLDSLDQTELRYFLEEEYGAKFDDDEDAAPLITIQEIVDFITRQTAVAP